MAEDRLIQNELQDRILADLPGTVRRIVLFDLRALHPYEVMQRWQCEPLISLLLLSEQEWQELSRHSAGLKADLEHEGLTVWPAI